MAPNLKICPPQLTTLSVEPFEFEGKTYAVFYSHNGGTAQKITDAQAFAASAGGTVMTVSSKAEMVAVNNYYYGVWTQPSSYFQERYDVCKPTSAGETFCKGEIFNERYLVGLIRQSDDSFRWDGDDAGYGDTFLASQYYWDKQQFRLDRGEEVQSYEVDHEIKSDILILRSNRLLEVNVDEGSYDWAYGIVDSYNEYEWGLNYAKSILVELPGSLSQSRFGCRASLF